MKKLHTGTDIVCNNVHISSRNIATVQKAKESVNDNIFISELQTPKIDLRIADQLKVSFQRCFETLPKKMDFVIRRHKIPFH